MADFDLWLADCISNKNIYIYGTVTKLTATIS